MKRYHVIAAVLMLCCAGLAGCMGDSGVKEEFDDSGRVTARTYSGGDPNYAQYLAAMTQQQQAGQGSTVADACAGDANCVATVAREQTLQAAFAALGARNSHIQPPAPKRTFGDRVESITKASIAALPGLGGIYASIEAGKRQERRDEVMWGAVTNLGQGIVDAGAAPTYAVGGDYIGGDRVEVNDSSDRSTHGDTIAASGDGNAIGDGNEVINGANAGNSGQIGNDNRQNSDGPFDDHSNDGDDCTGTQCQGDIDLPPEPVDPGT